MEYGLAARSIQNGAQVYIARRAVADGITNQHHSARIIQGLMLAQEDRFMTGVALGLLEAEEKKAEEERQQMEAELRLARERIAGGFAGYNVREADRAREALQWYEATYIQAAVTAGAARRQVQHLHDMDRDSRNLQGLAGGRGERREVADEHDRRRLAAISIQGGIAGRGARADVAHQWDEIGSQAAVIQSALHGRKARERVDWLHENQLRIQAAERITAGMLGAEARYDMQIEHENRERGARAIQGGIFGRAAREEVAMQHQDIDLLQSSIRAHASRQVTAEHRDMEENAAAEFMQAGIAGAVARQRVAEVDGASSSIQAAMAGRAARSTVKDMKESEASGNLIKGAIAGRVTRQVVNDAHMQMLNETFEEVPAVIIEDMIDERYGQVLAEELDAQQALIEQAYEVVFLMHIWFKEADVDKSGTLSPEELATLLKQYYKRERLMRSLKTVQAEVERAMLVFDHDQGGSLDFVEFLTMVATSPEFKFKLADDVKLQILRCLERQGNILKKSF